MILHSTTFATPFGPFSLAVDESGALAGTAFGGEAALRERIKGHALMPDTRLTHEASEQVRAYFSGKRRVFTLRLAPVGTTFQQRVWAALQRIPFGETRSYGELATQVGNPAALRAVGRANATNPICLVVPCHRVIGADGSLTGFAFGEKLKRKLLTHEGVSVA